jgi:CSLREA domain-containing protein
MSLELLETRQLLHGVSIIDGEPAYAQVSALWFQPGHQSSEVAVGTSAAKSASAFIGPQRTSATETLWRQEWVIRLSEQAASRLPNLTDADPMLDGERVNFDVIRGLGLPGMLLVESFSPTPSDASSWLSSNPFVSLFTSNDVVRGAQTPSDPSFEEMTNLDNTGQFGSVPDADIDGPEAWDLTTGSPSVVVGVIDSGIDVAHEDLFLNIWLNQSEIPAGTRGQLSDLDSDGLITFWDLNNLRVVDARIYVASTVVLDSQGTLLAGDLATVPQVSMATPFNSGANSAFVQDRNANGRIDAIDLLGDSLWVDGADSEGNGFIDDLIGWNFRPAANEPFAVNNPSDGFGHGTHVSGTIGAIGNNGIGVSGINWRSSILPIKFLDAQNQGSIADAIAAINYATLMRSQHGVNVRVTNNSWTVEGDENPLLRAAIESSGQAGILFVTSAGNGDALGRGVNLDATPAFPASFDLTNVVAVAASDAQDRLASFSNQGALSVDLAAPGVGILSALPGDRYGSGNGTSMAAAHVTAVASLVWNVFPTATVAEVRQAILSSVDEMASFDGRVTSNGRLNAAQSILAPVFTPQATVYSTEDVTTEGVDPHSFIVQYTYTTGIDLSTLGDDDLRITRSWGEAGQFAATLVPGSITALPDGRTVRATYKIDPPGGQWEVFDFGTYEIEVLPNSVASSNGLQFATAQQIGSFHVRIETPVVIYVNTVTDSVDASVGDGVCEDVTGACSLRAAIQEANAAAPASRVIILDVPESLIDIPHEADPLFSFLEANSVDGLPDVNNATGWSNESSGDLDVLGNVRIVGDQTELTKIRGTGTDRLFKVHPGASLTLERVTLTGGIAPADQGGGAILSAGDVDLLRVLVDGNRAINESTGLGGGGIAVWGGSLEVRYSTIANNTAEIGGGLLATGGATVDISESLIVQNHASSGKGETNPDPDRIGGGGIVGLKSGAINVQNSTFSANTTLNASGAAIGVYSLVPRVIVASSEVPRAIPDRGMTTSRLSVEGFNDVISDLRVTLSIDHTFNSDLSVFLISPVGTRVELFTDVGEGSNNFTNTTLADDALVDLGSASAPFTGTFRPEGQLTDFLGENPNGLWTLEVSDTTLDDVGTIRNWSLDLEPSEGSAAKGHLNHVTAAFNDGASVFDGRVRPRASLLAGNLAEDFGPEVNDRGFNVLTDGQAIGPLQSLGGPTLAHPLIAGSPAFDAADPNNFPSTDQRGSARPQQGDDFRNGPDVGAIEMSGGLVEGLVFLDRDGDTAQGIGETGLPQFTVFVDLNDNGQLDADEPRTVTHSGDEAGQYSFSNLPAGPHSVYLQVPSGWSLSFQDTLVSVRRSSEDGAQFAPGLSYDGNSVAFYSERPADLEPSQTNLLVLNRGTGDYFSPSFEDDLGFPGDEIPYVAFGSPSLSADGRYVAFLNTFILPFLPQPFDAIDVIDTRVSDPVPAGSSVASELTGYQPFDGMVSLNGRYVVFTSEGTIYLFDRQTATITNVSQGMGGAVPNGLSQNATISQDGQFITFDSAASNLVDDDSNGFVDVFVVDRVAQSVKRVSVASNGTDSNADAGQSSISGDGRYIVFTTAASNLIADDNNNLTDVFVFDQQSSTLSLVSRSLAGFTADGPSLDPSISANGRFVVFDSAATNLVEDDTNGAVDVFLFDRDSSTTIRIAEGSNAVISGDGKFIAFVQGSETYVVNNPLASISDRTVFLNAGGTYVAAGFGLVPADGELRGTLFEDLLPNASRDAADLGLEGWVVYLDTIANGVLDAGEPQTITDSDGGYVFTDVPGYSTFQVRAQIPAGWKQVLPDPSVSSSREVFVDAGETVEHVDLGFARESTDGQNQNASLSGTVFDDKNRNGVRDAQEMIVEGVTVFLDLNHDGLPQEGEPATVTDVDGSYTISSLGLGDYTLRVNLGEKQGVSTPRSNDFVKSAIPARAGQGLLAGVQDMILADLNGDALPDLVTPLFEANQVVIRLNVGNGVFSSTPVRVPLSLGEAGPVAVAAGQLNQLGSIDLVVVNQLSESITVLRDFSGTSFASIANYKVGSQPSDVVIGDFDGLQGLDLAISNAGSDTITLMLGDGNGGFTASTIPSGGVSPIALTSGDFNDDNLTDLAIANYGNHPTGSDLGNVSILFNAGNASFATPVSYAAGFGPASIAVADLNADGREDLAVASLLSNSVSVLLAADGGAFESTSRPIKVDTGPLQLLVADIDQDADQDLLVASATRQQVAILRNQLERGSFGISPPEWISPAAEGVDERTEFAIVDLDDDGRSELLLAGYSGEFISVLSNRPGTLGAYRLSLTGDETISNLDFGIIPTLIEAIILEGSGETVDMKLLEESLRLSVKLIDIRGTGSNTLILDAPTIQTQTPNQTLLAIANADDLVVFDSGWTFVGVETVDGQFQRIFANGAATLRLVGPLSWTNPINQWDVNGSGGKETAADALAIINALGPRLVVDARDNLVDPTTVDPSRFKFYDPNRDGRMTALDALVVINRLGQISSGSGEFEQFSPWSSDLWSRTGQLPVPINEASDWNPQSLDAANIDAAIVAFDD